MAPRCPPRERSRSTCTRPTSGSTISGRDPAPGGHPTRILVDADACPVQAKDLLYRVSERRQIPLVMVVNTPLRLPKSPLVTMVVVARGADEADDRIVELAQAADLVVTADIPLAARVIRKWAGAAVLDPRGTFLTEGNIGPRLALRDLMDNLRSEGMNTGGPGAYGPRDKQAFANQLDKWLVGR